MSRFVRPEMEVIRFTEEDVIVASRMVSDKMITFNFADGEQNNGYVLFNGTYYGNKEGASSKEELFAQLTPAQNLAIFMTGIEDSESGGYYSSISGMFAADGDPDNNRDHPIYNFNGEFIYDPSQQPNGAWIGMRT